MTPRWHVGLDAGGTKTALLARAAERSGLVRLSGPGANLQRAGTEGAARALADLARQLLDQHGGVLASLAAGVSGAGREAEQERLATALRTYLGDLTPDALTVVHDGAIALEAAFPDASGAIAIAGTGSLVLGRRPDGTLVRTGGWGYLLGDDGSGYDLGRRALRAALAAYDGGPVTAITALLRDRHGVDGQDALIHRVYSDDWPLADAAPLLLAAAEQQDEVAQNALRISTDALAAHVQRLAAAHPDVAPQLALVGGLSTEPVFVDAFVAALAERLPRWEAAPLEEPPVLGALRLAERKKGQNAHQGDK